MRCERKARVMATNKVGITVETEPIVKMYCKNFKCKYNLANKFFRIGAYCNLKHLQLDEDGKCEFFEVREKDESDGENSSG